MAAQVEFEIEMARSTAGLPVDFALLAPPADEPQIGARIGCRTPDGEDTSFAPVDKASGLNFGDAYERYLTDPTQAWSARTREAYETSRRLAVSVIGKRDELRIAKTDHEFAMALGGGGRWKVVGQRSV